MNSKLARTAMVVASAGAVAAGSLALAPTAEAAPGALSIRTYTKCVTNHDKPRTDHVVWVTNTSNRTVNNVKVSQVGGPTTGIPRMTAQQEFQRGGMHFYSATGVRRAGQLAPRESVKTWWLAEGCAHVPVIGYTTGSDGFNIGA